MILTRTSIHNLYNAESYDVWPAGNGLGYHIVVFRDGFSMTLQGHAGFYVWRTLSEAEAFVKEQRPDLVKIKV